MSCDNSRTAQRIKHAVEQATGVPLPASIVCGAIAKDGTRHSRIPVSASEADAALARLIRDTGLDPAHPDIARLAADITSGDLRITPKQALAMTSNIPAHLHDHRLQHADRDLADVIIPDDPTLTALVASITEAGGQPYLVGGAVRDMLLGAESKDLDIEVFGMTPDELEVAIARVGEVNLVGKQFGVYKVGEVDIALPRTEMKTGAGHQGFDVTPDPTLSVTDAAARRDFTINAISLDLTTGELVDPVGGVNDLRTGVLRHVGPAFAEDPLRVLRGMQFAARFDLTPHPDTIAMSRHLLGEQRHLANERVAAEWEKLMGKSVRPSRGIEFAHATGWLPAPLTALRTTDRDHLSTAGRALDTLTTSTLPPADRRAASWAVLTMNVPDTDAHALLTELVPDKGHAKAAWHTRQLVTALSGRDPSDADLRRLAEGNITLHAALTALDAHTGTPPTVMRDRAATLGVLHGPLPALIGGDDLIGLGMRPGPGLGNVLKKIRSAQLDGTATTRQDALQLASGMLD